MTRRLMPRLAAVGVSFVVTSVLAAGSAAAHDVKAAAKRPAGKPVAVPIEAFAAYDGQAACDAVEQPGVRAFRQLVLARYPQTADSGIVRGCDIGGRSEHKEGRAWDWHVDATDPVDRARAEQLIAWLLAPDAKGNANARARRLGLMYVIWDRHIWRSYRNPELGMATPYGGPHPHTDHVHFSFSRAGAAGTTSFWKLGEAAINPTGTDTAITVRYVDGALTWYAADERGAVASTDVFGLPLKGNVPVAGDWDGDGTATRGLAWREGRQLSWFLEPAAGKAPGKAFTFGRAGDVPVVGDWDGDGRTTVGVVRKHQGRLLWLVSNDNRTVASSFRFGAEADRPVVGDWDGDGRSTAGVVGDRKGTLRWYLGVDAVPSFAEVEAAKLAAAAKAAADAKAAQEAAKAQEAAAAKALKAAKAVRATPPEPAATQSAKLTKEARDQHPADVEAARVEAAWVEAARVEAARVEASVVAAAKQPPPVEPAKAPPAAPKPVRMLATAARFNFGERGQRPVAGDWNADGRTTFGTVEVKDGLLHWHLSNDAGLTYVMFDHGLAGDRLVVADLDGATAVELPEAKPVRPH